MEKIQTVAAVIAVFFVTAILGSTLVAILLQSAVAANLLSLTELVLSWPVAAGGLVFGGGQTIARALRRG
jgi:hypothetical protein